MLQIISLNIDCKSVQLILCCTSSLVIAWQLQWCREVNVLNTLR